MPPWDTQDLNEQANGIRMRSSGRNRSRAAMRGEHGSAVRRSPSVYQRNA